MDVLVQNRGAAPIYFQINKMEGGKPVPLPRVIFEPDNQITKISEEQYQMLLKNAFYKSKFENGTLVALNGGGAQVDKAVQESLQVSELYYAKYVNLVKQIKATGGTANAELRPYLDAEGMPSFDLCKKNLGDGFEIGNLEQFRSRYLVEEANGMHKNTLILPNGGSVRTGTEGLGIEAQEKVEQAPAEEVETTEEKDECPLEELSLEELKEVADGLEIEYAENISFKRLLGRVKKKMQTEE